MKEKENIKQIMLKKIVVFLILSGIAVIGGLLIFLFVVNPMILQRKFTVHAQAYFQALEEGDIQTASQYIIPFSEPGVTGSRSEWVEKALALQESGIIIDSVEDLQFGWNDSCITGSFIVVAKRDDEQDSFRKNISSCEDSWGFDGLIVSYGAPEDDSELVKDAKFLISSYLIRLSNY